MDVEIVDDVWKIYVTVSICYPLAFCGVCLRSYVKSHIAGKMAWDDWGIVVSMIFYTTYISFVLLAAHYGTGRHDYDLLMSNYIEAIRFWYCCEFMYVLTMTTLKVSICLFYLRLMVSKWQRFAVKVIMAICIIFGFAYFWCVIFQCWPISFIWNRYDLTQTYGSCLPHRVVIVGTYFHSLINAASDWALAVLPIFMLWNVQMRRSAKVMVAGILGCGAFASTATLIRLTTIRNIATQDDFLWKTLGIAIWSTVEPGVALFASSLATLRPLLRAVFPKYFHKDFVCLPPRNSPRSVELDRRSPNKTAASTIVDLENQRDAEPVEVNVECHSASKQEAGVT